jgi:hypothetical protein
VRRLRHAHTRTHTHTHIHTHAHTQTHTHASYTRARTHTHTHTFTHTHSHTHTKHTHHLFFLLILNTSPPTAHSASLFPPQLAWATDKESITAEDGAGAAATLVQAPSILQAPPTAEKAHGNKKFKRMTKKTAAKATRGTISTRTDAVTPEAKTAARLTCKACNRKGRKPPNFIPTGHRSARCPYENEFLVDKVDLTVSDSEGAQGSNDEAPGSEEDAWGSHSRAGAAARIPTATETPMVLDKQPAITATVPPSAIVADADDSGAGASAPVASTTVLPTALDTPPVAPTAVAPALAPKVNAMNASDADTGDARGHSAPDSDASQSQDDMFDDAAPPKVGGVAAKRRRVAPKRFTPTTPSQHGSDSE